MLERTSYLLQFISHQKIYKSVRIYENCMLVSTMEIETNFQFMRRI